MAFYIGVTSLMNQLMFIVTPPESDDSWFFHWIETCWMTRLTANKRIANKTIAITELCNTLTIMSAVIISFFDNLLFLSLLAGLHSCLFWLTDQAVYFFQVLYRRQISIRFTSAGVCLAFGGLIRNVCVCLCRTCLFGQFHSISERHRLCQQHRDEEGLLQEYWIICVQSVCPFDLLHL